MKPPKKREKKTYLAEPRDHEADARAAVEELKEKGHDIQKDGDCDDNCPICKLYGDLDPGMERETIISMLRDRFNATPESLKASLRENPAYYTINRTRLQALAKHPLVHVVRTLTEPMVIVEISMTINFDGYPITAVIRGLRPLLTDTINR